MFQIDALSRQPVYEQIVEQMERFVLTGIMRPGDQMPSVRSLSAELSINPNTIQKAYSELDRRGILTSVPGRGCFVSSKAPEELSRLMRGKLTDLQDLVRSLKLAGIGWEEIREAAENAYREGCGEEGGKRHD